MERSQAPGAAQPQQGAFRRFLAKLVPKSGRSAAPAPADPDEGPMQTAPSVAGPSLRIASSFMVNWRSTGAKQEQQADVLVLDQGSKPGHNGDGLQPVARSSSGPSSSAAGSRSRTFSQGGIMARQGSNKRAMSIRWHNAESASDTSDEEEIAEDDGTSSAGTASRTHSRTSRRSSHRARSDFRSRGAPSRSHSRQRAASSTGSAGTGVEGAPRPASDARGYHVVEPETDEQRAARERAEREATLKARFEQLQQRQQSKRPSSPTPNPYADGGTEVLSEAGGAADQSDAETEARGPGALQRQADRAYEAELELERQRQRAVARWLNALNCTQGGAPNPNNHSLAKSRSARLEYEPASRPATVHMALPLPPGQQQPPPHPHSQSHPQLPEQRFPQEASQRAGSPPGGRQAALQTSHSQPIPQLHHHLQPVPPSLPPPAHAQAGSQREQLRLLQDAAASAHAAAEPAPAREKLEYTPAKPALPRAKSLLRDPQQLASERERLRLAAPLNSEGGGDTDGGLQPRPSHVRWALPSPPATPPAAALDPGPPLKRERSSRQSARSHVSAASAASSAHTVATETSAASRRHLPVTEPTPTFSPAPVPGTSAPAPPLARLRSSNNGSSFGTAASYRRQSSFGTSLHNGEDSDWEDRLGPAPVPSATFSPVPMPPRSTQLSRANSRASRVSQSGLALRLKMELEEKAGAEAAAQQQRDCSPAAVGGSGRASGPNSGAQAPVWRDRMDATAAALAGDAGPSRRVSYADGVGPGAGAAADEGGPSRRQSYAGGSALPPAQPGLAWRSKSQRVLLEPVAAPPAPPPVLLPPTTSEPAPAKDPVTSRALQRAATTPTPRGCVLTEAGSLVPPPADGTVPPPPAVSTGAATVGGGPIPPPRAGRRAIMALQVQPTSNAGTSSGLSPAPPLGLPARISDSGASASPRVALARERLQALEPTSGPSSGAGHPPVAEASTASAGLFTPTPPSLPLPSLPYSKKRTVSESNAAFVEYGPRPSRYGSPHAAAAVAAGPLPRIRTSLTGGAPLAPLGAAARGSSTSLTGAALATAPGQPLFASSAHPAGRPLSILQELQPMSSYASDADTGAGSAPHSGALSATNSGSIHSGSNAGTPRAALAPRRLGDQLARSFGAAAASRIVNASGGGASEASGGSGEPRVSLGGHSAGGGFLDPLRMYVAGPLAPLAERRVSHGGGAPLLPSPPPVPVRKLRSLKDMPHLRQA
ncbi:hypothetical protein HYH03_012209 [Edaphochlamys debaryana]|uniref:Uncharacterized protein n=1 Tax=Edaphochlamys debaryana TaxID=47281 RepID=A0A835Y1H0_9CHLO|nr:hypothetical protein HYH03_012209 [Edaphochlamys debaryana]|eukprot:KAG2489379.1 hypothetical protein HYH03_012209 [Edaphochlamys debaryana]